MEWPTRGGLKRVLVGRVSTRNFAQSRARSVYLLAAKNRTQEEMTLVQCIGVDREHARKVRLVPLFIEGLKGEWLE